MHVSPNGYNGLVRLLNSTKVKVLFSAWQQCKVVIKYVNSALLRIIRIFILLHHLVEYTTVCLGALVSVHQMNLAQLTHIFLKLMPMKAMMFFITSQTNHFAVIVVNCVWQCLFTMASQLPS